MSEAVGNIDEQRIAVLEARLAEVERERDELRKERFAFGVLQESQAQAALRSQLTQAREALRTTHGVAQSMADSDSWIAEQAGMVRGDEVGEWVVPAAVQALATINREGETG